MARPKSDDPFRSRFQLRLLDDEQGQVITAWINRQSNASEAIRNIIYDFIQGRLVSADDMRDELADVLTDVLQRSGATLIAGAGRAGGQPEKSAGDDGIDMSDPDVQALLNPFTG